LRFGRARYKFAVDNPEGVNRGVARVELDGARAAAAVVAGEARLTLIDDGKTHRVHVVLGAATEA
jgi:cyclic beta-1,2-glucan synthetase